jgi:glutathionylspermidine synthase
MIRHSTKPRSNWVDQVEELGLIYHHTKGRPYWDESRFYEFTAKQVDTLEAATNEIQRLYLLAGQKIIDEQLYSSLGIPQIAIPLIEKTWKEEPPAIYGRLDLAYDGVNEPKLLEYNADTPTGLLEAAVVQWYWLQDLHKSSDQFNSIHERLIAKWKELNDYMSSPLYLAHIDDPAGEDTMTANYMRDTATQAGLKTEMILMKDIGFCNDLQFDGKKFVDMRNREIKSIFKLYPWEWMVHEEFGKHLIDTKTQWIEPAWKMLFSNKATLAVLWDMFPHHPNLLESHLDGPHLMDQYVRKPKMSREGANITFYSNEGTLSTTGDYGEEGFVFQKLAPVWRQDNDYAVIGSWIIDQVSAGIGIRESEGPITDNLSSFVPHLFS